jgi:nitrite reductase/ring-hydroxylating ferredoxin subunit
MNDSNDRAWETPPGVRLCRFDELEDPGARNFVLEIRGARFHGFAVRQGAEIRGYVDQCPHAGLPLARKLDDYLTPKKDLIACSWHGALFRLEDGACVGGPCAGARLTPWPLLVEDGWIKTG